MFINEMTIRRGSWQAFERVVGRLLQHSGFSGVKIVGQSSDRGADIIAHKFGRRWLFQVKHWKVKVGLGVVDETLKSMRLYRAQIPVIVALSGFDDDVYIHQRELLSRDVPLQLWNLGELVRRSAELPETSPLLGTPRQYQEEAIQTIVQTYREHATKRAMIVMATGLGKTFVAAESVKRIFALDKVRVLVVAHTNELVYQLEQAFWPFLKKDQETLIWNGYEHPCIEDIGRSKIVFGCLNTVAGYIEKGGDLPQFDIVLVDECHHVGAQMYKTILGSTLAGKKDGPFLLGLTATPWRPDDEDLTDYFGDPLVCIDIVTGMKKGFLSNVDYRMYTDNIKWEALKSLDGKRFSPRQINRTLFINEWDDAVVYALQSVWREQRYPRAIVFCGTIDHAITMRDRINSLGFCNAEAIYSQTISGKRMTAFERYKVLSDFQDGIVNVICTVDIFNEGIDVPDVNIIVFQRVTHSRRIFVQQLGRGLRVSGLKDKVIVLDFVSDIRRFAAGIDLKDKLEQGPIRVSLPHKVSFRRVGREDTQTESFLREWLEDVAAVESSGEESYVLKFPPSLPGERS